VPFKIAMMSDVFLSRDRGIRVSAKTKTGRTPRAFSNIRASLDVHGYVAMDEREREREREREDA